MNKVFNEIAERCGLDATPENPTITLSHSDLEYFGTQIVIECMRICEDQNDYESVNSMQRHFHL